MPPRCLPSTARPLMPPCCLPSTQHALKYEPSTHIVATGALATLSGAKTGRSPR